MVANLDLANDINTSGDETKGGVCVGTNARCNYVGANFDMNVANVSDGIGPASVTEFVDCGDGGQDETAVDIDCFVAHSVSDLVGCGPSGQDSNCRWDVWMINQSKEILHKQNATK